MGILTIHYEGYWQCRQATDPDPSDDWRGASGYTYAVGHENDFDRIIRLQRDEIADCDFRDGPEGYYPDWHPIKEFGIFVRDVTYSADAPEKFLDPSQDYAHPCDQKVLPGATFPPPGQHDAVAAKALHCGKVRWLPSHSKTEGPRFELRNTITYHPNNDGIMMPIAPFDMQIESADKVDRRRVVIRRDDPLDIEHPKRQIWEIDSLDVYGRRCPVAWYDTSSEAMQAINVSLSGPNNFAAFFQERKEWLQLQLASTADPIQRQAYRNRLFAIEFFSTQTVGYRMETRLGLMARWDFTLRGSQMKTENIDRLGGKIDSKKDWRVRFWMGAFDGDLMRGYMRGTLSLPFKR
jgi:hypothetical protein